jgi:CRP-like cAMP-binding protein
MSIKNQENGPNVAETLRRVEFFNDLDDNILDRFVQIATIHNFQPEETIALAGDTRRAIFFIAKGHAKLFSDSKSSRNTILSLLGIGDFFGEIQFFNESAKSTITVKAESECSVIIFRGKDFINEMIENPKLSKAFIKEMAQKLSKAYIQTAALTMNTIKARIRSCIMQFVEERGVQVPGKTSIRLKNCPTQQQMADICGTSRETVNRELAPLIKNGYIELIGKDLFLLKDLPL